jgi:hypothetical protein
MTFTSTRQQLGFQSLELCPDIIEQRIICAYIGLLFAIPVEGRRVATIGRVGVREIRLTETDSCEAPIGTPPFFVEVYCHAREAVLSIYGCYEFDDAELAAAVNLIMEAGREAYPAVH